MIKRYIPYVLMACAVAVTGILFYVNGKTEEKRTEGTATEESLREFCRIVNDEANKEIGVPFAVSDMEKELSDMADTTKPVLFFRFKPTQCNFCIAHELGELEKRFEKLQKHFVLLPTHKGHYLRVLTNEYEVDFPTAVCPDSVTRHWTVEENDMPYYFIVDKGKVSLFFLPEKTLPEETDDFFKTFECMLQEG